LIEALSEFYKVNVLELLNECRISMYISDFYNDLDKVLNSNQLYMTEELVRQINEIIETEEEKLFKINSKDLELIEVFFKAALDYHDEGFKDFSSCLKRLNHGLKGSITDFSIDDFRNFDYGPIDVKALMLMGMIMEKTDSVKLSSEILLFCLEHLINLESEEFESHKLIIKLYLKLAYNSHRLGLHKRANDYAVTGIDYATTMELLFCMPELYIRKGVSEFLLSESGYIESLEKGIWLFRMINDYENANSYIQIIKELYGLDIGMGMRSS